jgi:hypothetical protein
MKVKDQYYERVYKDHLISVYKPWHKLVWYMYLDKKYIHNVSFSDKKSAFEYLLDCIDND